MLLLLRSYPASTVQDETGATIQDETGQAILPDSVAQTGNVKVYVGGAWVAKPLKVWNGTAWVKKPVKVWSGTAWRPTNY